MSTVVLGEQPVVLRDWLERRRALGQDTHDEVWQGDYYVAPQASVAHAMVQQQVMVLLADRARVIGLISVAGFDLGGVDDYRVPDSGWLEAVPTTGQAYAPTTVAVLEVLSPDDKTWEKFPFYLRHGVREIVVADPVARTVSCWHVGQTSEYERVDTSGVFGVSMTDLTAEVRWP